MDGVVCHGHLVGAGDGGAAAVDGPDFGEVHDRVVSQLEGEAEAEALALLDELGQVGLVLGVVAEEFGHVGDDGLRVVRFGDEADDQALEGVQFGAAEADGVGLGVVLLQLEDDPDGVRLRSLAVGRAFRGAVGEPRGERDEVLAGRGVRVHDAHGACSFVELNRLFWSA
ncbi:hypothetical protein [Streptomyces vastus]|uniref:Uncharacterized protein n=1 Tax=Streptomyces vastus TaxID=285451 RepID=A0ABP6D8A4_9ACTN